MVDEFNQGDLFKNIDVRSSFQQMQVGQAKTQKLVGKTGQTLGSSNKILQTKPRPKTEGGALKKDDFVMKKPA